MDAQVIRSRRMLRKNKPFSAKIQFLMDVLLVEILLYACLLLRGVQDLSLYYYPASMAPLLMWIIYSSSGIYTRFAMDVNASLKLVGAWLKVVLIMVVLAFMAKTSQEYSRYVIFLWFGSAAVVQVLWHIAVNYMMYFLNGKKNKILSIMVGTGSLATYLTQKINGNPWTKHRIIAVVAGSKEPEDAWDMDGVPCVGSFEALRGIVEKHQVRRVYFALPLHNSHEIRDIQLLLLDLNVDIVWAPDIFGLHLISPSVKEIAGVPLYYLSESPLVDGAKFAKAVMDRVLAMIALILLSPVMLTAGVAVKLSSPGPVFFKQKRHGLDGKIIHVLKFRSMKMHEELDHTVTQAIRGDSRITKTGAFLRKTSIDELPQLVNVLKGDMSLVGPRPHALEHNEFYAGKVSAYMSRHRILPGITGLAQVNGCRGETDTLDKMERRVEYDLTYINNWSIWLDIKVMVKTVFTLFSKNAY